MKNGFVNQNKQLLSHILNGLKLLNFNHVQKYKGKLTHVFRSDKNLLKPDTTYCMNFNSF